MTIDKTKISIACDVTSLNPGCPEAQTEIKSKNRMNVFTEVVTSNIVRFSGGYSLSLGRMRS